MKHLWTSTICTTWWIYSLLSIFTGIELSYLPLYPFSLASWAWETCSFRFSTCFLAALMRSPRSVMSQQDEWWWLTKRFHNYLWWMVRGCYIALMYEDSHWTNRSRSLTVNYSSSDRNCHAKPLRFSVYRYTVTDASVYDMVEPSSLQWRLWDSYSIGHSCYNHPCIIVHVYILSIEMLW